MNGVQDTLKDGLTTPTSEVSAGAIEAQMLAKINEKVPLKLARNSSGGSGGGGSGGERPPPSVLAGGPDVVTFNLNLGARRKRIRKESIQSSGGSSGQSTLSKSWNDGQLTARPPPISFSSSGNKRGMLKLKDAGGIAPHTVVERQQSVVFEPPVIEEAPPPLFEAAVIQQMRRHVLVYAELLFRWRLFTKRLELLNSVHVMPEIQKDEYGVYDGHTHAHQIGLTRLCPRADCRMLLEPKMHMCNHCGTLAPLPACTICRLPVKGLSRSCLRCHHVSHISCWDRLNVPICPTGCGCFCSEDSGLGYSRPPTRLGMTPPGNLLLLSSLTTIT